MSSEMLDEIAERDGSDYDIGFEFGVEECLCVFL